MIGLRRGRTVLATVGPMVAWAVLAGCSSDPEPAGPAPSEPAAGATPVPEETDLPAAVGPALADITDDFAEIVPGGATTCARGAPFSFFVRKGRSDKVVFDFSGGGACWNDTTCAFATALFSDTVRKPSTDKLQGIYDRTNEANPFKDWTHVFIPYCTGDVHWGNATTTYGDVTIQHKGAENVRAALAWLFANVTKPEKLFVTGCSAGSYGSIMWAPRLRRHYPEARLIQFGDSGAGVITDDFFRDMQVSWKPQGSYPEWIVGDSVDGLPALYSAIANAYPTETFSQYNGSADAVQVKFFTAMGGADAATWSARMTKANETIAAAAPNYRYFTGDSDDHCSLPYNRFYDQAIGSERLVDWVQSLVDEKPVTNLACEGCAPVAATASP